MPTAIFQPMTANSAVTVLQKMIVSSQPQAVSPAVDQCTFFRFADARAPAMADPTVWVVLIGTPPKAEKPMHTAELASAVTPCHGLQSFLVIFLMRATMRQPPQSVP